MHLPNFGHDLGKVVGIQALVRYWERARGAASCYVTGRTQGVPRANPDILKMF